MIYHLLRAPIKPLPNNKLQWACICGLNVALPRAPVDPGTAIQVADEKTGAEIVECPACYAAVDERGESPAPVGAGANERDIDPTFDQDLGEAVEDDAAPDENDGEVLEEEHDEFPG